MSLVFQARRVSRTGSNLVFGLGGLAVIIMHRMILDPVLCVAGFHRFCYYRTDFSITCPLGRVNLHTPFRRLSLENFLFSHFSLDQAVVSGLPGRDQRFRRGKRLEPGSAGAHSR